MSEGTGVIRRFYEEVLAEGNLDLIDELASPDLVDHEEGFPGQPPGLDGVRVFVGMMRDAFPDLRAEAVSPTMADGDLEAARVVLRGTHEGEILGVAPTGNSVEFETLDIVRLAGGKVVEHWGVTDTMSLMQQIGAVPAEA